MEPTEGHQFYENKLQEFRKRSVNSDNYQNFIRDVNNIISEADSSIEEMRQDIKRKKSSIEEIKNTVGEDTLERLRKKNAQGYHYDLREIRKLWVEIAQLRQRMFERAMVRGDLHDVKNRKIQPILESLDAESIRKELYEQMGEITDQRIDNAQERLESRIESVESKVEANYKDLNRQIRDVREASRRQADSRASNLIEFVEEVIEFERQRGNDVSDLKDKKQSITSGEQIDDVDLKTQEHYEFNEDESEESSEIDNRSVSQDSVEQETIDDKEEAIKSELKDYVDGDSEFESQSEIAKEYGVTPGRVSQLKKEID